MDIPIHKHTPQEVQYERTRVEAEIDSTQRLLNDLADVAGPRAQSKRADLQFQLNNLYCDLGDLDRAMERYNEMLEEEYMAYSSDWDGAIEHRTGRSPREQVGDW